MLFTNVYKHKEIFFPGGGRFDNVGKVSFYKLYFVCLQGPALCIQDAVTYK